MKSRMVMLSKWLKIEIEKRDSIYKQIINELKIHRGKKK
jgi:hypothetical protein